MTAAVVGAAGLAVGTAFGPALATAGVDTFKDVIVRNSTDAEAVPTRSVGTSRVEVAGTPEVRIGAPVDVRGTVTPVRGRPFQVTGVVVVGGGTESASEKLFTVPPGEDLVITFATVQAGDFVQPSGTAAPPAITTLTNAGGPGIQVFLPMQRQGPEPFWSASLPMDVTFPDQLFFSARTRNTSATGFTRYDFTVSGYLVDEPAP